MARYSVATTRNNLSSLIDKALAGEDVVITRHGKPTVFLNSVASADDVVDMVKRRESMERLRKGRESRPASVLSEMEYKRIEQDEWESRFDR